MIKVLCTHCTNTIKYDGVNVTLTITNLADWVCPVCGNNNKNQLKARFVISKRY